MISPKTLNANMKEMPDSYSGNNYCNTETTLEKNFSNISLLLLNYNSPISPAVHTGTLTVISNALLFQIFEKYIFQFSFISVSHEN